MLSNYERIAQALQIGCKLKSNSPGRSTDLTLRCMLRLTHQGAAVDQEQSLMSTISLF